MKSPLNKLHPSKRDAYGTALLRQLAERESHSTGQGGGIPRRRSAEELKGLIEIANIFNT